MSKNDGAELIEPAEPAMTAAIDLEDSRRC